MSAQGGTGLCNGHMPRCEAVVYTDEPGAEPVSCSWAGRPDELSGLRLCKSHEALGLVNEAEALQLLEPVLPGSSRAQRLVASLFSGCLGGKLSLHNDLSVQHSSLLSDADRANVEAACKAELVRRHSEQVSGNGNLTKCHNLLNRMLPPSAPTMLAPPAGEAAQLEVNNLFARYEWGELGDAARGVHPTSTPSSMPLDLGPYEGAALRQLAQRQPAPATSLAEVLRKLKIRAGEDTTSNDFTQGFEMCDRLKTDVLMPDRRIDLHYAPPPEDGAGRPALSYLQRPASSLPPRDSDEHSDPYSDADLTELLCLTFEHQVRNRAARMPIVTGAWKVRTPQVVLGQTFKVHPELLPNLPPGVPAPNDCTLAAWRLANGSDIAPASQPVTNSQLTAPQISDLRSELLRAVVERYAAAGGTDLFWLKLQIDHGVPCWLITFLLMQFFGARNLGALTPADKLWLEDVVKSLHNGSENAMMVSESRNQYHVWLSLLLAMGYTMADIKSGRAQHCVQRVAKHTNTPEMIDFSSSFAPLPLAVDAATMLEVFHNYAHQLYLIGKRQSPGSQRQKAVITLAKWLFDMGDGARL